jgi:hypothetical protein
MGIDETKIPFPAQINSNKEIGSRCKNGLVDSLGNGDVTITLACIATHDSGLGIIQG